MYIEIVECILINKLLPFRRNVILLLLFTRHIPAAVVAGGQWQQSDDRPSDGRC